MFKTFLIVFSRDGGLFLTKISIKSSKFGTKYVVFGKCFQCVISRSDDPTTLLCNIKLASFTLFWSIPYLFWCVLGFWCFENVPDMQSMQLKKICLILLLCFCFGCALINLMLIADTGRFIFDRTTYSWRERPDVKWY